MKILLFRFVFIIFCLIISYLLFIIFLYPIFTASELIIPYGIHPFDICSKHPVFWYYFKIIYIITYFLSTFIISNVIYSMFFKNLSFVKKNHNALPKTDALNLSIGKNLENSSLIFLPSKSLYQNILITGTIGSGKTSSAMYPFTEQLLKYNSLSYSLTCAVGIRKHYNPAGAVSLVYKLPCCRSNAVSVGFNGFGINRPFDRTGVISALNYNYFIYLYHLFCFPHQVIHILFLPDIPY